MLKSDTRLLASWMYAIHTRCWQDVGIFAHNGVVTGLDVLDAGLPASASPTSSSERPTARTR